MRHVGLKSDAPVPPGATTTIRVRLPINGSIMGIAVDRHIGDTFELLSLKVGKDEGFLTSAPLPLSLFVATGVELARLQEVLAAAERPPFLGTPWVAASRDIALQVANLSGVPLTFRGILFFLASQ